MLPVARYAAPSLPSLKVIVCAPCCSRCCPFPSLSQGGCLCPLLFSMLSLYLPFRRQGNFKKDKALRKERKAEKEARKQA